MEDLIDFKLLKAIKVKLPNCRKDMDLILEIMITPMMILVQKVERLY